MMLLTVVVMLISLGIAVVWMLGVPTHPRKHPVPTRPSPRTRISSAELRSFRREARRTDRLVETLRTEGQRRS